MSYISSGSRPGATVPSPTPDFAVIKDARRRQRRRRLLVTIALLTAGLIAYVALRTAIPGSVSEPSGPRSAERSLPPSTVFSQPPSMGIACGVANWAGCDRVGLDVRLTRPATVIATFGGHRLQLDDPQWSHIVRPSLQPGSSLQPQYEYAGLLQAGGLTSRLQVHARADGRWFGRNAPSPLVRFRIDYASGQVVNTQQRVSLRPGWG